MHVLLLELRRLPIYRELALLFVNARPTDAIGFHHDGLDADDPKSFFIMPGGGWFQQSRRPVRLLASCRLFGWLES